jgi:hypothetical protein
MISPKILGIIDEIDIILALFSSEHLGLDFSIAQWNKKIGTNQFLGQGIDFGSSVFGHEEKDVQTQRREMFGKGIGHIRHLAQFSKRRRFGGNKSYPNILSHDEK